MNIWEYLGGVFAAVGVLALMLAATVWLYLFLSTRFPSHKFKIEAIIVVAVVLASLIIRMVIGFKYLPPEELSGGATSFFHALFSAIAGLTFNSLWELGDMGEFSGFYNCMYYGIIAYASLVFLIVATVGLSYEFYSRVQTLNMRRNRGYYYIFTAITPDSLLLAKDIKRKRLEERSAKYELLCAKEEWESAKKRWKKIKDGGKTVSVQVKKEEKKKYIAAKKAWRTIRWNNCFLSGGQRFAIIFFEDGQESFSRKNPLHRIIMEEGFYYFSDFRRNDKGDTVSLLQKFNFKRGDCKGKDFFLRRNKLFYVFAMEDCGGFEGNNSEIVFADVESAIKRCVRERKGKVVCEAPTTLNYFLLTGGEINYESYKRRMDELIFTVCRKFFEDNSAKWQEYLILKAEAENAAEEDKNSAQTAADQAKARAEKEYGELCAAIKARFQINVFNEATLSSQNMVEKRRQRLSSLEEGAFATARQPDKDNVYRAVVLGFGKTGQYAMEELYVQTAHISGEDKGYIPSRFIADVYDPAADEKSGLFAYNHPFFRCVNVENASVEEAKKLIARADGVQGQTFDALYEEYAKAAKVGYGEAKKAVDEKMQFPVLAFHSKSCYTYPLMNSEAADAAINEAAAHNIRAFIVALGNDESDIAMANVIIDAFKRAFTLGKIKPSYPVTVYVNLIEPRSFGRLNWQDGDDKTFAFGGVPFLSVVSFGCRTEMFSYSKLMDDYAARLYNYSYGLYTPVYGETEEEVLEKRKKQLNERAAFRATLTVRYDYYRTDDGVSDSWTGVEPFVRRSNASAQEYSVNYLEFAAVHKTVTDGDKAFLGRLEHERWNRFYIAHGWVYAKYPKELKAARRDMRQHDCLCPFDVMLSDSVKQYDVANVELGLIEGIVYGNERRQTAAKD